jgi:hypothetical protein
MRCHHERQKQLVILSDPERSERGVEESAVAFRKAPFARTDPSY